MIRIGHWNPWREDGWALEVQSAILRSRYCLCEIVIHIWPRWRGVEAQDILFGCRAMACIFFFLAWRWAWMVTVCLIVYSTGVQDICDGGEMEIAVNKGRQTDGQISAQSTSVLCSFT